VSRGRVIGVDLGGTKILAGVIDDTGHVHEVREHPTPLASQDDLVDALYEIVSELRADDVVAAGFGVPARVDPRTGIAFSAVNLPIANVALGDVMSARLGMPVGLINDGNAAALAEFRYGAGRGSDNLLLYTLGTGVGGGVVLGGELYRGWAEVGHMVIVEDGEPCQGACTGRGHVEAYCSGRAADRVAREVLGPGATARDLVKKRHPALAAIGHHLGVAVGSLVNLVDPDVVVIGGGFGVGAGELLLGPVRERLLREALAPAGERVRLAVAELGSLAGVIGAGRVAFDAIA
jgi:glucokinase